MVEVESSQEYIRDSEITKFVVDNATIEQLAISLTADEYVSQQEIEQRAETRFREALKKLIETAELSKSAPQVQGCFFDMKYVRPSETIVVKSMMGYSGEMTDEDRLYQLNKFNEHVKEHNLTAGFYGNRFIPDTIHLTLETPLHDGVTPHVIVQEKKEGLQLKSANYEKPDDFIVTEELQREARAFITVYERMLKETGLVIDLDVMIDTKNNRIWLFDTSSLGSPVEGPRPVDAYRLAKFKKLFDIEITDEDEEIIKNWY